jgi:hypothetical protein
MPLCEDNKLRRGGKHTLYSKMTKRMYDDIYFFPSEAVIWVSKG